MRQVLIEVGFDLNVASLNEHVGPDVHLEQTLYPLQHAFVLDTEEGSARPLWPTQLEERDRVVFRIFDITREPLPSRGERPVPTRFEAWFKEPDKPKKENVGIFSELPLAPVLTDRFQPLGEPRQAHSFGYWRNEPEKGCFSAWHLETEPHTQYTIKPRPEGCEVYRVLMALLLEVAVPGEGKRNFVLDPELQIGPYGGPPDKER